MLFAFAFACITLTHFVIFHHRMRWRAVSGRPCLRAMRMGLFAPRAKEEMEALKRQMAEQAAEEAGGVW